MADGKPGRKSKWQWRGFVRRFARETEERCGSCGGDGTVKRSVVAINGTRVKTVSRYRDVCPRCGGKGKVAPGRNVLGPIA